MKFLNEDSHLFKNLSTEDKLFVRHLESRIFFDERLGASVCNLLKKHFPLWKNFSLQDQSSVVSSLEYVMVGLFLHYFTYQELIKHVHKNFANNI